MTEQILSPREAWAHFWKNVKPEIWGDLDKKQRMELTVANHHYSGKRPGFNLGVDRIARLLGEYAPGIYRFEKVEVFHLV